MAFNSVLFSKGVEHPYYLRAQVIGWSAMSWVWYSMHVYFRSESDSIGYFVAWSVTMFISCFALTHFFLRPIYWWLSRSGWGSERRILTFLFAIHGAVWGMIVSENLLFLFVPVPIENFERPSFSVLLLYHIVIGTWALIYHHWTCKGYRKEVLPKENVLYYVVCQLFGWLIACGFWYVLYTGRGEAVEVRMDFFWPWIQMVGMSGLLLSHSLLRPFFRHLLYLDTGATTKFLLSLGVVYICTNLGMLISIVWGAWSGFPAQRTEDENFAALLVAFAINGIWSLIYSGWLNWQQKINETTRRLKIEANYKDAQILGLKQQLNPHFMFNALNSLRAMIIKDQEVARKMVTEISNLLRYSLYESEKDVVPLSEEIEIVKNYLSIEMLRYDGRVSITWDVPEHLLGTQVVPLCIQTLVENAIKHAINQYEDGIFIRICVDEVDTDIHISVCNRGKIISREGGGIGLKNTRERMALLFEGKSSLVLVQKEEELVEAVMVFPSHFSVEQNENR